MLNINLISIKHEESHKNKMQKCCIRSMCAGMCKMYYGFHVVVKHDRKRKDILILIYLSHYSFFMYVN